ncbi:MAG: glycosyltransferase [Anaerolineae bacterium]|nr:glycosyltransferase [Anaerolineae bacterium]
MPLAGDRPLRILLISRCPPYPLHLGDRLIPYHLVRELSRRDHRVDLLAFYQQPEDMADVPHYRLFFDSVTLIREPARSPLSLLTRALRPDRRFPACRERSWSPEMWDAIADRLGNQPHKVDVVHLFGGVQVYEFRALACAYPNLIAPYESYSLFLERALTQARHPLERARVGLQRVMARHYESWMFSGYQRAVVVSEQDARTLRRLTPGLPVAVIPNGVDLERFVPTEHEPDTPTLIFTGNYDYAPNVDAALLLIREIFPAVRRAIPEAELLIVGHNPPAELRRLEGGGVRVTGRVPDLRPYLDDAHVYVSPLRVGAGIKNKILEAMAMQTAVVATPMSCDGIDIRDGRDVILAREPAEISRAAIRLLQDAELRRRIAHHGRRLVETRYTWGHVASAYEDLYSQLIREYDRSGGACPDSSRAAGMPSTRRSDR